MNTETRGRGGPPVLTDEEAAELIALAEAGVTYTVLGKRFGISRQGARQRASRAGIHRAPAKGIVHLKDPEAKARAQTAALLARAARLEAQAAMLRAEATS